jgi:hypothetical protein
MKEDKKKKKKKKGEERDGNEEWERKDGMTKRK